MSTTQPSVEDDLFGIDLVAENQRLRKLNMSLVSSLAVAIVTGAAAASFGVVALLKRPEPDRIGLDPGLRAIPLVSLTKNDPPDAKITQRVADCMNSMFNHGFHNYQTTVEKAIGDCVTGGGSESVRQMLNPFLQPMADKQANMAGTFVIQPFINNRGVMGSGSGARNVFYVQGVIAIGYRGGKQDATTRPVEYAFQSDVIRVSYDSHLEGTRLQNIILKPFQR